MTKLLIVDDHEELVDLIQYSPMLRPPLPGAATHPEPLMRRYSHEFLCPLFARSRLANVLNRKSQSISEATASISPNTILIIDPDAVASEVKGALETSGYLVWVAESAAQASRLLGQIQPG